ncbi:MAG: F0F1 ATP synthase subunit gamma [Actinomycetes bacterium]|jgi:F-type H+-transporting ATPase subunit gamma|nr:F0F1 ATP synthase subunit gamma [Actinomycetes bacterium]
MANLKEIKKRINATGAMRQVTRTMEMVSTAKIRGAQNRIEHARPYAAALAKILGRVTKAAGNIAHPLLEVREDVQRVMIVAVASDRGQAGAFNSNVIHLTEARLNEHRAAGHTVELVSVGRKVAAYFRYRGIEPDLSVEGHSGSPTYEDAKALADRIIAEYSAAEIDQVVLIYNRFVNVATQRPEITYLLPAKSEEMADDGADEAGAALDYLFEPSAESVLETLLPSYVESLVFKALLESAASEHGARRTAMKAATDNAETMINTLTRSYNRARQAAITTEIAEIVGGAAALEG